MTAASLYRPLEMFGIPLSFLSLVLGLRLGALP